MKPPPNPNGPNSLTPTPGNLTSALDRLDSATPTVPLIRWSELPESLDATGQDATHEGPDDLVLDTPELRTWLAAQVIESRYALVQHGAPIRITAEQIISGELDFTRLASIRPTMAGQRLQPQPQATGKAPKAPASGKGPADPRTPKTRKTTAAKDTPPSESTSVIPP